MKLQIVLRRISWACSIILITTKITQTLSNRQANYYADALIQITALLQIVSAKQKSLKELICSFKIIV